MNIELKDLLAWGAMLVSIVGAFFHLKGRVLVLETRQNDLREAVRDGFEKLDKKLDHIDAKLDKKADK